MKTLSLLTGICFFIASACIAQKSVLPEIGATYFTNNLPNPTNLNDFGAFSFSIRCFIKKNNNSAFAFETPISLTTKFNKGKTVLIGMQVPVVLTYSIGAGASDNMSEKKMGYTIGAGASWFYHKVQSKKDELPAYCESLSEIGPIVKGGIKFSVKSFTLFKTNGRNVHPYIGVNILHQFNLNDSQKNIGSLSLMLGFAF